MALALLILLIAASAFFMILATFFEQRQLIYIFKPLTTTLILMIALFATDPITDGYKTLIIVGLLFSLGGDVALMLPNDRFVEGLASFFVAHVFYILAFSTTGQRSMLAEVLIPVALGGIGVLGFVWTEIEGRLKAPVLAYVTVIVMMTWMAITRAIGTENTDLQNLAILAAIGAVLFMISDAVLAIDRFKFPFRFARPIVLSTYFAAQTLIALSV